MYKKNHQPEGLSPDPEGRAKLSNAQKNMKNAKWNQINKKRRVEMDKQYILDHPECGNLLTDNKLDRIMYALLNSKCVEEFPFHTLLQLIESKVIIVYFGLTFRLLRRKKTSVF